MFKFVRRAKQEQVQEPSLRELCDAVAAHPDSVIVAVFDTNDFVGDVNPAVIDHEYVGAAIYRLVMEAAAI
jgi:hypothetical protein